MATISRQRVQNYTTKASRTSFYVLFYYDSPINVTTPESYSSVLLVECLSYDRTLSKHHLKIRDLEYVAYYVPYT